MASPPDGSAFQVSQALPLLARTPSALRSILEDLPDPWLHFREAPEAWSPHTVLVHFVHNEQTNWIPRLRVLLSNDPVRRFAPFTQLPEDQALASQPAAYLLGQFERLRNENLSILAGLNLPSEDLGRTAEHPVLGTVTLGNLLATWVVHDLNHLHQIAKTLAKRYKDAVGPWRRNLPLVDL